jgi:hypothetical protein
MNHKSRLGRPRTILVTPTSRVSMTFYVTAAERDALLVAFPDGLVARSVATLVRRELARLARRDAKRAQRATNA